MKTLHLTLKKKWFDLIAAGIKREEYRQRKPYWQTRLVGKTFDQVTFKHGYAKTAPTITLVWLGMVEKTGNPAWGAEPGEIYYTIRLGDIVVTN